MKTWLWGISLVAGGLPVDATFCRCQPGQSCWPSETNWAALNKTIGGSLVAVKPFASPCHNTTFNAADCAIVQDHARNSSYRSSQPGALQWENWEAWPQAEEQCYINAPQSAPCRQGRVSLFSAEVRSSQHIQAAVKFAAHHNLKLVIKNTGHDFLGRSSAPNSLQIMTHWMKNISIVDDFVPTVPTGVDAPGGVKAVTLGAGVQLHDVYVYLRSKGVMIVGGSSSTVGAAGGYIQGGGHSVLGQLHGMASDNALEFEVVLADGSLAIANAHQNTDLFFALRGGGGGSFSVVVSVTVKAHPDYPVVYATANFTTSPDDPFWAGVDAFHRHVPRLNDNGGSGYYSAIPLTPVSENQTVSTFLLYMMFVNQTSTSAVNASFVPLLADLKNATGVAPAYHVAAFPTLSSLYTTLFQGSDVTGSQVLLGSHLISRSLFDSGDSSKLTSAMSEMQLGLGELVVGMLLSGGQVSRNRDIESALNPAWRDTLLHVVSVRLLSANMTFAEQKAVAANITQRDVPRLKALEPGKMGAYLNEADANEADFQTSFWGSNYPRLRAIKHKRDPHDLFITRKGVGSDRWDESGLCRVD
ncbi:hypothetical protein NUU61_002732 [Penicillium alfredii]|uniref:FAD-binding PCMH-type domain-containing protein n=1 Tax=Penicillium alfredii TaxID=1506179 RepID=A0A9W9FS55_9EURO|nr:uncharacterized protein NUU61_002732 [Penicillium alfredii]KAJ5105385.1 hypothetical protein NUU61_002732 [Penicillium alfredii]